MMIEIRDISMEDYYDEGTDGCANWPCLQISVQMRISRLSSGKDSALGLFLWVILTYDPGERDSHSLATSC